MLTYILLSVILILLIAVLLVALKSAKREENKEALLLRASVDAFSKDLVRIEGVLKTELKDSRGENAASARHNREELASALRSLGETLSKGLSDSFAQQKNLLDTFSARLDTLTQSNNERFDNFIKTLETRLGVLQESSEKSSRESRKELKEAFENLKTEIQHSLNNYKDAQRENFNAFQELQKTQHAAGNEKLDALRRTMENSIKGLQEGNEKKLEEMRLTVDEKLQKTLESRLGESFKQVSERLEAVHKGLGDMQQLATGVGDLKKVLGNVKTRGVIGEYQLENLLEQMLTPEQFGRNVKTKAGSNAMVEFAIKLPGQEPGRPLWIPIDAKFPREDYDTLHDAYDKGDAELIESTRKNFVRGIKKFASDINDKYIDPPNTTEFAILFLPFESLYAEALRTPGLFETVQREHKAILTGPTTLSAILTSLQMGFRTLSIEKKSGEVWDVLGVIKKEFSQFGVLVEKTQKKIQEASNVISSVQVRNRVIAKTLRSVEELSEEKTLEILGLSPSEYKALQQQQQEEGEQEKAEGEAGGEQKVSE